MIATAIASAGAATSVGIGLVPVAQIAPLGSKIDAYAVYDAQNTCDPVAKPGVVAVKDLLNDNFGKHSWGIDRACDVGGTSEHKEGRALDYMLDAADPKQRQTAQSILDWLLATDEQGNAHANARRLGVMYIIWDRQMWKAFSPKLGWQPRPCDGSPGDCHTNHIHISFSRQGALKQTSWWTSASPAPTVSTAPAPPTEVTAVLAPDGSPWVFGRAADGTLHQWYEANNGWLERSLGGSLAGDAVAVRTPDGNPWVFGRATDGTLRHWSYLNGTWPQRNLGGSLAGDPAVAVSPDGSPWVFGRAADNTLHHWTFAAGHWIERTLGGSVTGEVTATLAKDGTPWVFGRTTQGALHQWYLVDGTWSDRDLGGPAGGDVTAVVAPDGSPWLFGRGDDDTLAQWYFAGSAMSARSLGASLTGPVTVAVARNGTPWVFGRAKDGTLQWWYYVNGTWFDHNLGGVVEGDVAAVVAADGSPWVFARAKDGALQRWYYTDRWVATPAAAPTVQSGQTASASAPPAPAAR
ncbi:hypothetical protein Rhe02_49060 [Rhizocola hellebori]|uniref:Uncharacterized protein n=1 Tax=Rhizocola hellebori TaxID=1392758 RepID=A0A8J3Q9Z7_9ACTN|nr:hypothetical protein Rhe02_49060 [Rhizocola hellebori]